MSDKNTGGAAFPQREQVGDIVLDKGGMNLRDYFAAKALPSVYEQYVIEAREGGFDCDWRSGVANDSYAIADAMLRARENT